MIGTFEPLHESQDGHTRHLSFWYHILQDTALDNLAALRFYALWNDVLSLASSLYQVCDCHLVMCCPVPEVVTSAKQWHMHKELVAPSQTEVVEA